MQTKIATADEKLSPLSRPDSLQFHLSQYGLKMTTDELYVQWEIGNRRHPRNWDVSRKVYDISLIFFLEFFTCEHLWFNRRRNRRC